MKALFRSFINADGSPSTSSTVREIHQNLLVAVYNVKVFNEDLKRALQEIDKRVGIPVTSLLIVDVSPQPCISQVQVSGRPGKVLSVPCHPGPYFCVPPIANITETCAAMYDWIHKGMLSGQNRAVLVVASASNIRSKPFAAIAAIVSSYLAFIRQFEDAADALLHLADKAKRWNLVSELILNMDLSSRALHTQLKYMSILRNSYQFTNKLPLRILKVIVQGSITLPSGKPWNPRLKIVQNFRQNDNVSSAHPFNISDPNLDLDISDQEHEHQYQHEQYMYQHHEHIHQQPQLNLYKDSPLLCPETTGHGYATFITDTLVYGDTVFSFEHFSATEKRPKRFILVTRHTGFMEPPYARFHLPDLDFFSGRGNGVKCDKSFTIDVFLEQVHYKPGDQLLSPDRPLSTMDLSLLQNVKKDFDISESLVQDAPEKPLEPFTHKILMENRQKKLQLDFTAANPSQKLKVDNQKKSVHESGLDQLIQYLNNYWQQARNADPDQKDFMENQARMIIENTLSEFRRIQNDIHVTGIHQHNQVLEDSTVSLDPDIACITKSNPPNHLYDYNSFFKLVKERENHLEPEKLGNIYHALSSYQHSPDDASPNVKYFTAFELSKQILLLTSEIQSESSSLFQATAVAAPDGESTASLPPLPPAPVPPNMDNTEDASASDLALMSSDIVQDSSLAVPPPPPSDSDEDAAVPPAISSLGEDTSAPPPIPAPGFDSSDEDSGDVTNIVKQRKQPRKVKQLFWQVIPKGKVKKTIFAKCKDTIEIDEVLEKDLERDFSTKIENENNNESPTEQKNVLFVTERKATNIEIILRKFSLSPVDICKALLTLDPQRKALTDDNLEALLSIPLAEEEIALARAFQGSFDAVQELGIADQFIFFASELPNFSRLVAAAMTVRSYGEISEEISSHINGLRVASESILNSIHFPTIMNGILALGNFLNEGTRRGDAKAFKLETLTKVREFRSNEDKEIDLVYYLIVLLQKEAPDCFDSVAELKETCLVACRFGADDIRQDIMGLERAVEYLGMEVGRMEKIPNLQEYQSMSLDSQSQVNFQSYQDESGQTTIQHDGSQAADFCADKIPKFPGHGAKHNEIMIDPEAVAEIDIAVKEYSNAKEALLKVETSFSEMIKIFQDLCNLYGEKTSSKTEEVFSVFYEFFEAIDSKMSQIEALQQKTKQCRNMEMSENELKDFEPKTSSIEESSEDYSTSEVSFPGEDRDPIEKQTQHDENEEPRSDENNNFVTISELGVQTVSMSSIDRSLYSRG